MELYMKFNHLPVIIPKGMNLKQSKTLNACKWGSIRYYCKSKKGLFLL